MNKQGFTLIELLVTIVVLALIMSIVFPSAIRLSGENKTKIYSEYEKMMVEYAQVSPLRKEDRIDLDNLDELDKVKEECDGYVTIDHTEEKWEYKAYIKCGDQYTTDGYVEE